MKLKFMKKMIAVLCASVMTTSCVVGSVGAIKRSVADVNTDRENRVLELTIDVSRNIDKVQKVIDAVEKYAKSAEGNNGETREALNKLKNIQQLLIDIDGLKLCHDAMIDRLELSLKFTVGSGIDEMVDWCKDGDMYELVGDISYKCDDIKMTLESRKKMLQFSTNLDDKRFALYKAGLFIKKVNDVVEKSKLQKCYDDAQNYYNKIQSTIVLNKKGEKQAKEFFDLADKAIDEINKARNAQKNKNVNLPIPPEPDDMNKAPAPMVDEKENLNRIKEEKKKERERIREEARKAVERQLKEMDERIKREREEAKKQAEERAKKKEELKKEERNLEEEFNELNKKAEKFRNLKAIYDGWYTSVELPVIERLAEVEYRLQEVRSDLMNMDMPEIFVNMKKEFKGKDEEKELVRKKFEINRKHANLKDELSNIVFLRGEGIYLDSTLIERDIETAEKQ